MVITNTDGKVAVVRMDVFADPNIKGDGRGAISEKWLNENGLSSVKNMLLKAGLKTVNTKDGMYFLIDGADYSNNKNIKSYSWVAYKYNKDALAQWDNGRGTAPVKLYNPNFDIAYLTANKWQWEHFGGIGFLNLDLKPNKPPVPSNKPSIPPGGHGGGGGHGGHGGGSGGGGYKPVPVSESYHGTVTVEKNPSYVLTVWHRQKDGSLPQMTCAVSWRNIRKEVQYSDGHVETVPVSVVGVDAYHDIDRYEGRGRMYVCPVERLSFSPGTAGSVSYAWRYERPGKPDSTMHYLLRLSDGTVLDVNFDVPVNGWKTSILPPQGGEDRFPLKLERSVKDRETVTF